MPQNQVTKIVDGLKAEIIPAVEEKIRTVVNGKIDTIKQIVEDNHEETKKTLADQNEVLADLRPWAAAGRTIKSVVDFCKFIWPVVPIFGLLWAALTFFASVNN